MQLFICPSVHPSITERTSSILRTTLHTDGLRENFNWVTILKKKLSIPRTFDCQLINPIMYRTPYVKCLVTWPIVFVSATYEEVAQAFVKQPHTEHTYVHTEKHRPKTTTWSIPSRSAPDLETPLILTTVHMYICTHTHITNFELQCIHVKTGLSSQASS